MGRYLVVANETLLGMPLAEEVKQRVATDKECLMHIVVPAAHGMGMWTEGQAKAKAARQLEHGEARLKQLGVKHVTGEVGDPNPVLAVGDALLATTDTFDEVIVSTLPLGKSRWLKQDVVHRLHRTYPKLHVTHVVSASAPAEAESKG